MGRNRTNEIGWRDKYLQRGRAYWNEYGVRQILPPRMKVVRVFTDPKPSILRDKHRKPVLRVKS